MFPAGGFAKEFDDRTWAEGEAAFGSSSIWNGANLISTPWNTSQIHMRRWFRLGDVTPEMINAMRFRFITTMIFTSTSMEFGQQAKKGQGFQLHSVRYLLRSQTDIKPNSWKS